MTPQASMEAEPLCTYSCQRPPLYQCLPLCVHGAFLRMTNHRPDTAKQTFQALVKQARCLREGKTVHIRSGLPLEPSPSRLGRNRGPGKMRH